MEFREKDIVMDNLGRSLEVLPKDRCTPQGFVDVAYHPPKSKVIFHEVIFCGKLLPYDKVIANKIKRILDKVDRRNRKHEISVAFMMRDAEKIFSGEAARLEGEWKKSSSQ